MSSTRPKASPSKSRSNRIRRPFPSSMTNKPVPFRPSQNRWSHHARVQTLLRRQTIPPARADARLTADRWTTLPSRRHRTFPRPQNPRDSPPLLSGSIDAEPPVDMTFLMCDVVCRSHSKKLPHGRNFSRMPFSQSILIWLSNENPIGNLMGTVSRIGITRIKCAIGSN
jgi:hypothetical protein